MHGYAAQVEPVTDTRDRPLRDLRISVTDRCDFRCVYCMPKEVFGRDFEFLRRSQLLTFEEITRLARIFAAAGVRKLRLTGGEPLLRRDLERLVEMLAAIDGIEDIALTTNGSLLARKARTLHDAGLRRVTVSLDSLDDEVFGSVNDVGAPVSRVLEGIEAAAAAGLGPVKVNMVVKRGLNDASVLGMARHFRGSGHILRLIEFMDVGASNGWRLDDVVPAAELVSTIAAEWPLEAGCARLSRRGCGPLPLSRRRRRDRRHRVGHPAVLQRLQPRAPVGRRTPVHVPVRKPRPRPARAAARRRERRRPAGAARPYLGAPRRPLLGAAHGADRRRAQGRDVLYRRLTRRRAGNGTTRTHV